MRLVVTNQRIYLKEKYTIANAWRVVRVFLRGLKVIGIVFLVLIGLVLLPLLIGFIVDLAVTPQWCKAQKESVDYFARLRSQRYSSISLPFVTLDKNAWVYYDRAAKLINDPSCQGGVCLIDDLWDISLGKDSLEFPRAESLVQKYEQVYALFDSGACCRYYTIPEEYRKDPAKPLVSDRIPPLARLAVVKGRLEMAKGNPQTAAEIYAKVLKMGSDVGSVGEAYSAPLLGADISGGGSVFAGRMVGIEIGDVAVNQASSDINQFDLKSSSFLREAINQIERSWPPLDSVLEAKGHLLLLPSVTGWDGLKMDEITFLSSEPYAPLITMFDVGPITINTENMPGFLRGWVDYAHSRQLFSYGAWRYLFSVRLSTLNGIRKLFMMADKVRHTQPRTWSTIKPIASPDEKEFMRDVIFIGNPVINAYTSLWWICEYYYKDLFALRLLKSALWLQEYKLKYKEYPGNLEKFLASDSTYYDLANNQPLHVARDSTGQKIRLYSVGQNLKDDGGKFDWEDKDDIKIEFR